MKIEIAHKFDRTAFNSLPDMDGKNGVGRLDLDAKVRHLGALIRSLFDVVGVCRLHKHFMLGENEMVVFRDVSDSIKLGVSGSIKLGGAQNAEVRQMRVMPTHIDVVLMAEVRQMRVMPTHIDVVLIVLFCR